MPHKPVVRKQATTTKVRTVHDASSKPSSEDVSLNQCLYIGPILQPLLFDILARLRIHPIWITGDVKQAFLQISIAPQDRDALRFLYISPESGKELHLRFTWLPFGGGPSPFGMRAVFRRLWDENETNFQRLLKKCDGTPTLMTSTKGVTTNKSFVNSEKKPSKFLSAGNSS